MMMLLKDLDVNKLSMYILPHVDQATCIECCKFYMVPTTAPCGHTLCHGCWLGRKECATCGAAVDRKTLRLNLQLQKITEHTHNLREEYEKITNMELDEFTFDTPVEKETTKDPTKNVREWLANSENQFSGQEASQQSTQDFNKLQPTIECKVQIHSAITKTNFTNNHVVVPQDDWDKIEEMPDTEEMHTKNKENPVGPMDIEPFVVDEFEFTSDNPRRSSRKRENKGDVIINSVINSIDQNNIKKTNETDSNILKNPKTWANVNRMKKEFSKLNKKYKSKLNVSIEMCKKTAKKIPITSLNNSEDQLLNIDEITPSLDNPKECGIEMNVENDKLPNNNQFKNVENEATTLKSIEFNTQDNQVTKHITDNTNFLSNHLCNESFNAKNYQVPQVAFIMKGALQASCIEENYNCCDNNNQQYITVNTDKVTKSTDDIEITIKIGNTLTNICIKKNEKDVQFKINADKEIQTSLDKCILDNKKNALCSPIKEVHPDNIALTQKKYQKLSEPNKVLQKTSPHILQNLSTIKPSSSKKNTDSANTVTVQYEITESIEKELSKEMDTEDIQGTTKIYKKNVIPSVSDNMLDEDCLNELDGFHNDSLKERYVQSLKSSNHPPSEILISTMNSKKHIDKRAIGGQFDVILPVNKKRKLNREGNNENTAVGNTSMKSKIMEEDSEFTNYDMVMGQVFANIDLDLEKKADETNLGDSQFVKMTNDKTVIPINSKATPYICDSIQGQSDNVFSLLEKGNETVIESSKKQSQYLNQRPSGKSILCLNKEAAPAETSFSVELTDQELSTPAQNNDDASDDSIVEETPQKNTSFQKVRQKSGGSLKEENTVKNKSLKLKRTELAKAQNKPSNTQSDMVINLSDITDNTVRNSKHVTVVEAPKARPTLETPLTINKFIDQVKYNSTPVAKKSLKFDNKNIEVSDVDPEQTLCSSLFAVAKTTQEKEFMSKAFKDSPHTRTKSPLVTRNRSMTNVKYCLLGSCLVSSEIENVKMLCSLKGWDYSNKYTNGITHLVVGVDKENRSQRSVKYMCALAASKWIVSYEWVLKCLQVKTVVDEEPYETLDSYGEPGPRRSRLAKKKLFQGMTFFCMPPFSVLDVDTLKTILEAAGGRVVDEAKAVRVTSEYPALLLAEPEHTQEDRFTYLALELSIVPVNYEWLLNCLGGYTICSVQKLLLCPPNLLPPATAQWPQALMAKEYD